MPESIAESNIVSRFIEHATASPDQPALVEDTTSVSYGTLNRLRQSLAAGFFHHGLRPRDTVCICNAKSPLGYAAMLACLSLGIAYVNIDPENPATRFEAILDQARPGLLALDGACPETLTGAAVARGLPVLSLAALAAQTFAEPPANLAFTGSLPAYLMFTSGSTGTPKGAVISHNNLAPFIDWIRHRFAVTAKDIFTGVNPIYFDNSVFDFYGSLFNRAALAPVQQELLRRPAALIERVDATNCSIWFSVPSLLVYLSSMKLLDGSALSRIRCFVFGGEGFPKPVLRSFFSRYGETARLVNVYGPTECTCICTSHDITAQDFEDMTQLAPLGELNANFDSIVLDGETPCAAGAVGELCLMGPGIGLGYINDPTRTAASFVDNPANPAWPERMYRTGDLVSVAEDGRLHFHGRRDHQIKHMGYRIELEEIEAALNTLPGVMQSAAILHRPDPTRPGRILAFVAGPSENAIVGLREELRNLLPPYMIPFQILTMSSLPKNANGKVDRPSLAQLASEGAPR